MRFKLDKRALAFIFIFLIGLSILLYPLVSSTWNQLLANRLMGDYDESVSELPKHQISEILEAAHEYNNRLLPKKVPDAFSIRESTHDLEYEALLNVTGDGMMGYINIPVIKARSPIYHYTTDDTLEKGVGHLFGSSLPVGGKSTHAVLTAHRGLPNNKLFSDLDKIVKGDKFFITICDETFAYQVDKIQIVEPDQTESLAPVEGKDYVTLVTCTPYGVNTHRILCRGYRIPYVPGDEKKEGSRNWLNMNIVTGLIGAILGLLFALILARRLKKRKEKQGSLETEDNVETIETEEIEEATETLDTDE